MKKLYHQVNKARKSHLDTELAKYRQGDKLVQDYYNGYLTLWNEIDSMILSDVPTEALSSVINIQKNAHISQFLMNLRYEYESIRAALLNREVPPAFQALVQTADSETSSSQSMVITPDHIRDMINASVTTAFISMGVNGRYRSLALSQFMSPSSWFIDPKASNHTTSMEQVINAIQPYTGNDLIINSND